MLLLLIRNQPQGQAVHGNLFIQHHDQGKTILTHVCTTLENQQYIIPALFYNISVTTSPNIYVISIKGHHRYGLCCFS